MADEREFLLAQHTHCCELGWKRMKTRRQTASGQRREKKHGNWMKWKLNSHLWREPSDLNKTKTLANAHGTTNRKIYAPLPMSPGSVVWRMCPPMADGNRHFIHLLACWVYARVCTRPTAFDINGGFRFQLIRRRVFLALAAERDHSNTDGRERSARTQFGPNGRTRSANEIHSCDGYIVGEFHYVTSHAFNITHRWWQSSGVLRQPFFRVRAICKWWDNREYW